MKSTYVNMSTSSISQSEGVNFVMPQKFHGTFSELFDAVNSTSIPGRWFFDGVGMHTFRSEKGGVLNWWQTTKTVQFQGKLDAKDHLERLMKKRMRWKNK
jgi:hypothetical protein